MTPTLHFSSLRDNSYMVNIAQIWDNCLEGTGTAGDELYLSLNQSDVLSAIEFVPLHVGREFRDRGAFDNEVEILDAHFPAGRIAGVGNKWGQTHRSDPIYFWRDRQD